MVSWDVMHVPGKTVHWKEENGTIHGRQNSDWGYKQIPDEKTLLHFFLVHTGVPTIQGPVIIPFLKSHTTFTIVTLLTEYEGIRFLWNSTKLNSVRFQKIVILNLYEVLQGMYNIVAVWWIYSKTFTDDHTAIAQT